MNSEHIDVLIVGAGLSGIGAAYHLQHKCPDRSFAIFEGRERLGGTWDLFRYPGIRSDSDMFTLGYAFRPWQGKKMIADGDTILDYVAATARENGIDRVIRFGHKVKRAAWSSRDARWTVEAALPSGAVARVTCDFLYLCSGYYSYAAGYTPEFTGRERFNGPIVHPQNWPADLEYAGKRVVVIGSGATAITLVPSLAESAGHVTMLQRSPTYVFSLPDSDPVANRLRKTLPAKTAYQVIRARNISLGTLMYGLSRRRPELVKRMVRKQLRAQLGPDFDIDTHFKPKYEPWDQRFCLVRNGDLFRALRKGTASIVTDQIEAFTETGIRLQSGRELAADIIVTATGLSLVTMGGIAFSRDGAPIDLPQTMSYKGLMLSDVPNLAYTIGYTNASWTLKADLTAEYVCRLLNHMRRHGYRQCVARNTDPTVTPMPLIDLASGYVQRAAETLPKQGSKMPWRLYQNYLRDLALLRYGALDDQAMVFQRTSTRGTSGP